jgi:hypothetical protein
MAKKYFLEYLETRENWEVSANETIVYTTSIYKGVVVNSRNGFDRKKDAVAYATRLNNAAGYEIAKYWGSTNV